jgi:hypothetical protein
VSISCLSGYGQESKKNQITFQVSNVKVTKSNLSETTYKRAIEQRISRLIEGFPSEKENVKIVPTGFNAFVASIHFAYAEHRPLIISPDMIWLTICQGFSIHVNKNYTKLRSKIVKHQGKKNILITRDNFIKGENNPWENVFEEFTDSVKNYIKDDLYDLAVADFSTTGVVERAAYQVTLMEGTKKYFELTAESGCGIPQITLEGNVEDWKWIRNNIEKFRKYDLDIWINNLIPILDEFVLAAEGKANKRFWESIYKVSDHYTPTYSSGWMLKFFPYYQKWKFKWNNEKSYKYTDYLPNPFIEGENYRLSTLTTEDFPNGVSKFPFVWKYTKDSVEKKYDMEIYAGFIGLKQNKETKSVRAEISWAVRDKKSSWLSAFSTGAFARRRSPYEYFYTSIESKPSTKPIFKPKESKNYTEGISKLNTYIKERVDKLKQKEKLSQKVIIKFVVTWAGTIADIRVIGKTNSREEYLAKQIIKRLPKWEAGIKKERWQREEPENYAINYEEIVVIDFRDKHLPYLCPVLK